MRRLRIAICQRRLSHLILFDVFHHLRAPNAFLREARRVLTREGRLILSTLHQLVEFPVLVPSRTGRLAGCNRFAEAFAAPA